LFDKIIDFDQTQLHRLVHEFVTYYHTARCHFGREEDTPDPDADHAMAVSMPSGGPIAALDEAPPHDYGALRSAV